MSTKVTLHVPEDKDLLAAIGEMVLQHEHLNYILRLTIKTLAQKPLSETLDTHWYKGSDNLRKEIRKLGQQKLGEGPELLRLQDSMLQCKRATNQRNEVIHSLWANERGGETKLVTAKDGSKPLPTKETIAEISRTIVELYKMLNHARLSGYLHEALARKEKRSTNSQ